MKFAVVGGGISGCASALWLLDHGHEVALYETGPALGGVLRDLVTAHGRFFQGCQYLNPGTPLMDLLQPLGDLGLKTFPHRYGAWSDLFGPPVVHHDFAQVVVPGALGAVRTAATADAAQRLTAYEPRVANALTSWATRFGRLDQLEADNCGPMQVGRVFYRDAVEAVRQAKRDDPSADRLLGLPRSEFQPPQLEQAAALPVGGYDAYFTRLQAALLARDARIHCRSPVKPVLVDSRPNYLVRGEPITADWVVWCGNPTPLLLNLAGERLDAPATACANLLATVDGRLPDEPVYYQTFGAEHPLLRLFSYSLNGPRLTVECLDQGWPLERLVVATNRVMEDIGWHAYVREATLVPQSRYTLVTREDKQRFERFEALASSLSIVPGGWQHYGRDARLASIFRSLEKVLLR